MAGFKKAATTATATIDNASKMNLFEKFPQIIAQLKNNVTDEDAGPLPDSLWLDSDVQEALAEVAQIIGFEYSAETTATFKLHIGEKDGSRNLYGPSLTAYGADGCAIIWSAQMIELPAAQTFGANNLTVSHEEFGLKLFVDPSGYCLPVDVRFDEAYQGGDKFKKIKTKLMTVGTFGDLAEYLQRGEPIVKWPEMPNGQEIQCYTISPGIKKDSSEVTYFAGLAMMNGSPVRIYYPGAVSQWVGVEIGDEPLLLTKQDSKTVAASDGTTYELKSGGRYKKLPELATGRVGTESIKYGAGEEPRYTVIGFSVEVNKFDATKMQSIMEILIDGAIVKVNGNTGINNYLMGLASGQITPDKPSTLIIISVTRTNDSKDRVIARLEMFNSQDGLSDLELARQAKREALRIQKRSSAGKQLVAPNPF